MFKNRIWLLALSLVLVLSGCGLASVSNPPARNDSAPQTKNYGTGTLATSKVLDLSNKGLEKLSSDVFKNKSISELDISGNKLTGALLGEIRFLKNLKVLNASDNLMTGIPAEIGQLSDLEVLNYANNDITGLPLEIGNLKKLKILNLSGNDFSENDLSRIMEQLPDLEVIR